MGALHSSHHVYIIMANLAVRNLGDVPADLVAPVGALHPSHEIDTSRLCVFIQRVFFCEYSKDK